MAVFNSLLPARNRTPVEVQLEQTMAGKYALDADIIRKLHEPAECPVEFLPWLAYAVSVDVWDDNWDEVKKRRVIAASVMIHRKKGTIGAVRATLEALGVSDFAIKESFNDARVAKGFFYVEMAANNAAMDSPIKQAQARQAIDKVKKLSAHYAVLLNDEVRVEQSSITSLFGVFSDDKNAGDYQDTITVDAFSAVGVAGDIKQLGIPDVVGNIAAINYMPILFTNSVLRNTAEPVVKIVSII